MRRTGTAFLIYIVCLLVLTLTPFDFSNVHGSHFEGLGKEVDGWDFLMNVVGFLLFGALAFSLTRPWSGNAWLTILLVISLAAITSSILEYAQGFLPTRSSSVHDIGANIFGAALGASIVRWLIGFDARLSDVWRSRLLAYGVFGYTVILIGLMVWIGSAQELETWNPEHPLVVGNEASLTRPWLGNIFLVAVYDRALDHREVEYQFRASRPCKAVPSQFDDPLALYMFREGEGTTVSDLAGRGEPLDLEIQNLSQIDWLPGCGVGLREATILKARNASQTLIRSIVSTNSFSVIAWIEPANTEQKGPARIVSLSLTASLRNFTLGQDEDKVHFRVRNAIAGDNGTRWALITEPLNWSPSQPAHIVATYDHGARRLYFNGAIVAEPAAIDMLGFIGRVLKLEFSPMWQKLVVVSLLVAPVIVVWLVIRDSGLNVCAIGPGTAGRDGRQVHSRRK